MYTIAFFLIDMVKASSLKEMGIGAKIEGKVTKNLRYADDNTIIVGYSNDL
jgi:hypothetical protein